MVCLCGGPALGWTAIGSGIEYQAFTTSGPNNLFVARMARSDASTTIESCIAGGFVGPKSGGGYNTEIVRNQAGRCDDAINWWGGGWGQRNDVKIAINGDFFSSSAGITGGQIQSGWYAKRFTLYGGISGFGWRTDRTPFFGGCLRYVDYWNTVTYADGYYQNFHGVNTARGTNQIIVYTPHYNNQTPSASTGVEVLVRMDQPTCVTDFWESDESAGRVVQIWQNSGSHYIPFDCVVLSASGYAGALMLMHATVGSRVSLTQKLQDMNEMDTTGGGGCETTTYLPWRNTYASVSTNYRFLKDGVVRSPSASDYPGLVVRDPRTAVACNSDHVFFVVCDGRTAQSVGMTMTELGNWCVNTLGATDGANLDGGGSSTMVVKLPGTGALTVVNHPSDGSERAVGNGLVMVNVAPKLQSTTYSAGQQVKTTASASLRLGPGTNYGSVATIAANSQGIVLDHPMRGGLRQRSLLVECRFRRNRGLGDGVHAPSSSACRLARWTLTTRGRGLRHSTH